MKGAISAAHCTRLLIPLIFNATQKIGHSSKPSKVLYSFTCHSEGSEVRSFRVLLTPMQANDKESCGIEY